MLFTFEKIDQQNLQIFDSIRPFIFSDHLQPENPVHSSDMID